MTALDFILEGLEAELALERELGVRSVEIDRALLAPLASPAQAAADAKGQVAQGYEAPHAESAACAAVDDAGNAPPTPRQRQSAQIAAAPQGGTALDFAFLHHRPLGAGAAEMIEKITAAMGKTAQTAPVAFAPPLPEAKVYVILGGKALKMFFPAQPAAPGQWITVGKGVPALVTYSPEYVLRFSHGSPQLAQVKREMWNSLKNVMRRIKEP